ncbi:Macrolide export ATP-binding/permease protein MacB [compost metagenome]
MEIFQDLNDHGKTIVLVTHDIEVSEYAKRLVHFRDGQIEQDHPVENRRFARKEVVE